MAETSFWSHVDKEGPEAVHSQTGAPLGPCWLWTGYTHPTAGYGQAWSPRQKKVVNAQRVAYERTGKDIPEGLVLDHLCRRRACVNPDHLEPVTQQVNVARGERVPNQHAHKTHCPKGHPYSFENTYVDRIGRRTCKACRLESSRRFYKREQEIMAAKKKTAKTAKKTTKSTKTGAPKTGRKPAKKAASKRAKKTAAAE